MTGGVSGDGDAPNENSSPARQASRRDKLARRIIYFFGDGIRGRRRASICDVKVGGEKYQSIARIHDNTERTAFTEVCHIAG